MSCWEDSGELAISTPSASSSNIGPVSYSCLGRLRAQTTAAIAARSTAPPTPKPTPRPIFVPVDKPPSFPLFWAKTEPGPKTELLASARLEDAASKADLLASDTADWTTAAAACVV